MAGQPLYDLVVLLHVAGAAIGFGSIVLTGVFAELRRRRGCDERESVRRYFATGTNWAPRCLYSVPLLGGALLAMSHARFSLGQAWLMASLVMWASAMGLAEAIVWPGERRIAEALAQEALAGSRHEPAPEIDRVCRRVAAAATTTGVLCVVAVVLMVAKPGTQ